MLKVKKIAQLTGHNASIFALAKGKDERHFLSGAGDGWVVEWTLDNPDTGRLIARVKTNIFSLLALPNTQRVIAGNMNGGVHWVNLKEETRTKNIQNHQKGVFALLKVKDFIFSAGGAGMLTKWSETKERSIESLHISNQSLRCIAYSASRNELAVGSSDRNIYLIDADNLDLKQKIELAHDNSVFSIAYSKDEKILFSGGRDAHLNVWDLENENKLLSTQPAHYFTINSIALHPKGHILATGSRDKTIKIWDAKNFKLLKVLDTLRHACHINSVNDLLWLNNTTLLSASDDRSLILWRVELE